ncbi:MAG TPA: carbonic anhydrase [Syntrophorhabdaceae bacterium]|nr:carbonic anhydrase [Syntrophorhabdaceae bacterium]
MADLRKKEPLELLMEGNKRYVSGKPIHPNQDTARRTELSSGQRPFAVIVGCSDSRVPPEIIFDQGIGDIFVIRVAGNIVDDVALGSIEYAVEHLGTELVVVLGHSKCGAVTATVKGGEAHGHIGSIVHIIMPAVEKAKTQQGDMVENAIRNNMDMVTEAIKSAEPIITKSIKEGRLKVISAYYDIDTGVVEFEK